MPKGIPTMDTCKTISALHLCFVLSAIIIGCSPGETGYQIETIDGIPVRIYGPSFNPLVNPFQVEERQIIGADQGEETYLLMAARPAALGNDGTLYVIEPRDKKVHIFSRDGAHLGSFGRRGSGPGEFNSLSRMIVDGEYLYFMDTMQNRITITTSEGSFVSQLQPSTTDLFGGSVCLFGESDARKYLSFGIFYERYDLRHFRLARWNEQLDFIDAPFQIPVTELPGWMRGTPLVPFTSKVPVSALSTDMPFAWQIGDQCRIDFMDPNTLERWAVIAPHERVPFTAPMRERLRETYRDQSDREEVRNMRFPDYFPHFQYLFWDNAGRLWALEYKDPWSEHEYERCYVFSSDGEWLFIQDLPSQSYRAPISSVFSEDGYFVSSRLEDGTPVVKYFEFVRADESFK